MFRVYYADFDLAQNHNVSAFDALDAYQHTFDYGSSIDVDGAPFSERLYKLLGDDIWNFNLDPDRAELLPRYRGHRVGYCPSGAYRTIRRRS